LNDWEGDWSSFAFLGGAAMRGCPSVRSVGRWATRTSPSVLINHIRGLACFDSTGGASSWRSHRFGG
jgi:hypothetical protein